MTAACCSAAFRIATQVLCCLLPAAFGIASQFLCCLLPSELLLSFSAACCTAALLPLELLPAALLPSELLLIEKQPYPCMSETRTINISHSAIIEQVMRRSRIRQHMKGGHEDSEQ